MRSDVPTPPRLTLFAAGHFVKSAGSLQTMSIPILLVVAFATHMRLDQIPRMMPSGGPVVTPVVNVTRLVPSHEAMMLNGSRP